MNITTPISGTAKGMPMAEIIEIRDNLRLALDQIETGQMDFMGVLHAVRYQRAALTIAHRRLETMRGAQ